jgi:hypothetical protein
MRFFKLIYAYSWIAFALLSPSLSAQKDTRSVKPDSSQTSNNLYKRSFKIAPMSVFVGAFLLSYERVLKPNTSLELNLLVAPSNLTFYGPSLKLQEAVLYFGTKSFGESARKDKGLIQGWYFHPEVGIGLSQFKYQTTTYQSGTAFIEKPKINTYTWRAFASVGKQFIWRKRIVFDSFFGIGVRSYYSNDNPNFFPYLWKVTYSRSESNATHNGSISLFGIKSGINVGFLF